MSETRPSFSFYARDWYIGTRGMAPLARAAHVDLLALSWINGGLPSDANDLRLMVGFEKADWRAAWPALEAKWPVGADGLRRNTKLEGVRAESAAFIESARAAGKASVVARRKKYGTAAPPNGRSNGPSNDPPNGVRTPPERPFERKVEPAIAVVVTDPPLPPKGDVGGGMVGPWPRAAGTRAHPLDEDQSTAEASPTDAARAATLLEAFSATHLRLRKSRYVAKPQRDYDPALRLVLAYSDAELGALTAIYMTATGEQFDSKPRTPGHLAHVAPMLEERLKEVGEWPRVA